MLLAVTVRDWPHKSTDRYMQKMKFARAGCQPMWSRACLLWLLCNSDSQRCVAFVKTCKNKSRGHILNKKPAQCFKATRRLWFLNPESWWEKPWKHPWRILACFKRLHWTLSLRREPLMLILKTWEEFAWAVSVREVNRRQGAVRWVFWPPELSLRLRCTAQRAKMVGDSEESICLVPDFQRATYGRGLPRLVRVSWFEMRQVGGWASWFFQM